MLERVVSSTCPSSTFSRSSVGPVSAHARDHLEESIEENSLAFCPQADRNTKLTVWGSSVQRMIDWTITFRLSLSNILSNQSASETSFVNHDTTESVLTL